jgi:hypothetical protein
MEPGSRYLRVCAPSMSHEMEGVFFGGGRQLLPDNTYLILLTFVYFCIAASCAQNFLARP